MSNIDWNEFKEELKRQRRAKYVPTMPPVEKNYYFKSIDKTERDKIHVIAREYYANLFKPKPGKSEWTLHRGNTKADITHANTEGFMSVFDLLIEKQAIKGKKLLTKNYDYINQDIEDKLADKIKDYFDDMIKKQIEIEVKKRETDIREEERVKAEREAPNRPKKKLFMLMLKRKL